MTHGPADQRPERGGGRTSLVQRVSYPPGRRVLTVRRVADLSPTMRRIVLAGPDLERDFPFLRLAPADHVKLVLPDEDTGALVMPERGSAGLARPDGRPVVTRDYSVRAYDPGAAELTLDFVLHDHGPAGRWGGAATPGALLGVMGPRGSQVFPAGLDHYVLVADETGLPALERFLEELPQETRVDALVLAPEASRRELPGRSALDLTWTDPADLGVAAAQVLAWVEGLAFSDRTFAWAAGEAGVMRELRTRLRRTPTLSTDRVAVRGYWRTGVAGAID